MSDDDTLTVDNIEEAAHKAVKIYWDKGMMADAMFWSAALSLLKKKWGKIQEKNHDKQK